MSDTLESLCQTRHTLLERIKNPEDEASWKEFVSYYEQYIYNILRSLRIPKIDADEICQDIIVKLWKKGPEITYDRDRGKFRHWLNVIIRNAANDYFNALSRKSNIIENQDHEALDRKKNPASDADIDKIVSDEWKRHIFNLAWESVRGHFQESVQKVFLLRAEGKSNKEISQILNIQEGSIRMYISRIRKCLKDEIDLLNKELL